MARVPQQLFVELKNLTGGGGGSRNRVKKWKSRGGSTNFLTDASQDRVNGSLEALDNQIYVGAFGTKNFMRRAGVNKTGNCLKGVCMKSHQSGDLVAVWLPHTSS